MVSGAALLVDYVLTITVSIAAGADAIFSVLPHEWLAAKLLVEAVVIGLLVVMLNLRGVKESVTMLAPIFLLFVLTHAILIVGGITQHAGQVPEVARSLHQEFRGARHARAGRHARRVPQGLLDGRRHLHRHRGGLERPADHARAAGRTPASAPCATWRSRWPSPPAAS